MMLRSTDPRAPSMQMVPTLGPKVYKWDLLWAIWSPRVTVKNGSHKFKYSTENPKSSTAYTMNPGILLMTLSLQSLLQLRCLQVQSLRWSCQVTLRRTCGSRFGMCTMGRGDAGLGGHLPLTHKQNQRHLEVGTALQACMRPQAPRGPGQPTSYNG